MPTTPTTPTTPTMTPSRKTNAPVSGASEAADTSTFRNLYTRVLLSMQAQQHQILGVTSAIGGEGKTTIASGLTAALAEDGALLGFGRDTDTALLVGCNMGAPPEDPRLAPGPGPGLIQLLRGECELEAAIHPTGVEG